MLHGFEREPVTDPEEILTGICYSCKTVVEIPRGEARRPQRGIHIDTGIWNDCWSCECPQCKATVYLGTKG